MITLFTIGPFAVQSYGAMIVLGILVMLYLFKQDKPLMSKISFDQILNLTSLVILFGVIGARLLYLVEHGADSFLDAIAVWDGGLSVFGAIIPNLILVPLYLHAHKIPVIFVLDRVAIYVPLLHSIARLGCALVGCCHGRVTNSWLHVMYTNADSMAPIDQPLVPVQLLSALGLFIIFLFLYYHRNYKPERSGYLFGSYLYLSGNLRFILDFLRAGHTPWFLYFSHNQVIAWCIMFIGLMIKNNALRRSPFKKFNAKDL